MKTLNKDLIINIEKYINNYEKITTANAKQAISDFDENWNAVLNYSANDTEKQQSKYAIALVLLSKAIFIIPAKENVFKLSTLINEYEKNVKEHLVIKQTLFYNLGGGWYKLGSPYNNRVIEAFKKYVYYIITASPKTDYLPTAYSFRKCNTHLYQSLINDQLNISSPTAFNDPFDCPIYELLDNGEEIATLMRQAYKDCLKIACFTKPSTETISKPVSNEKKHEEYDNGFSNSLMWAHYADNHKGICIKYNFKYSTSLINQGRNIVSYFKDVRYSNEDMRKYSKLNDINDKDAFFLKGKEWEYEKELRYLYFNTNDKEEHKAIDIPNCIEAIYFGLRCSEKDKETIMNIMRNKKFITEKNGKKTKKSVLFYQMKNDKTQFGRIIAVRIPRI